MTRLIRRAVLATAAALASIGLHGQPTTADDGLLGLDGLLATVVDGSDTGPDPGSELGPTPIAAPIATLLEQPTAVLQPVLEAVGGPIVVPPVIADLVDPLLPVPLLPVPPLPPPAVPLGPTPGPDDVPVPAPPNVGPDAPSPDASPDAGAGPAPTTEAVVPPVVDPRSRPAITGPADDIDAIAIGDADRGRASSHAPGPASAALARGRGDSHIGATALPGTLITSPVGDEGTPGLDGNATGPTRSPAIDPDIARDAGPPQAPVERSTWDAAVGGGGRFPTGALAVGLASVAAVAVAVAALRRATAARRERLDEVFADSRHAANRVPAGTSPPSREPPSRVSAQTRPSRVPPRRASADARPNRREPRPGIGGRSVERVGRDRRVLRSPPARSPRPNAQRPAGPRRRSRGND